MQTVNERLRDESIAHAVWISRYSTGVAARMVKILNDSDAELTARLLVALDSLDPGSFTVTRLESLLASVREVIGAHTHSVAIGSHGHTITVNAAGNAENTVKNIAFNYIVRLA
ncbi:TPA: hypothetical protein JLC54_003782 [Escherichia coli]|nr:hypothetical protein [Escherichia coli]